MANRYWIGGDGTWDQASTAHWSSTSGGAGGASIPTASDNVIFDANSDSGTGFTVTVIKTGSTGLFQAHCANFDVSAIDQTLSLVIGGSTYDANIYVHGNIVLSSLLSTSTTYKNKPKILGVGTGTITYNGCIGNITGIGIGDNAAYQGSYSLADDWRSGPLRVTKACTFVTNNHNLTLTGDEDDQAVWIYPTVTSVVAGTSTWTVRGSFASETGDAGVDFSGSSLAFDFVAGLLPPSLYVIDPVTFGAVEFQNNSGADTASLSLFGSNTFASLSVIGNGHTTTVKFPAGKTQTLGALSTSGSALKRVVLQSTTNGTQYTLWKSSGTVSLSNTSIKDSVATGGALFEAQTSNNNVDAGNNSGWLFSGQGLAQTAGIPSAETFGVGAVTLLPTVITQTAGIPSAEAFGSITITMYASAAGIATAEEFGTHAISQSPPPPAPPADWSALGREDEKVYVYRVYTKSGTFIGIWPDVKDDLEFTQQINTPGTTTTVLLARSAQTKKEVRGKLLTQAGDPMITEDSNNLVVTYETTNNVGDGTDVVEGYYVDVYVYYGEYGYLLTQAGDVITTEGGDKILVATGAPMGRRIFSGFILDYEAEYGPESNDGVTVTLASHGWELSNEEVLDGSNTNVTMTSTSPEQVVKNVLDTNPGKMTYAAGTLGTTGVTDTFKFQLNTKLEAIQSAFDRTPDDYYWFGDVTDSLIYMKQASATADHTFILGKHIKSLKMKKSIESLVNRIYFVGGEVTPGTPSSVLYKKYEDATSISTYRKGLLRITDRRYTVAASAALKAGKSLSRYKDPIFSSPLEISSATYDIESIRLGHTVQFRGFNNYIDALPPLLIVSYGYNPYRATLQLGELQARQFDALADAQDAIANDQYETLPNAPS